MSALMGHCGMLLQPPGIPVKWSATKKHADVTLSNGNLTASIPATGAYKTVLADQGKSDGKWQFELVTNQMGGEYCAGVASDAVSNLYLFQLGASGISARQSIGIYRESGTLYWNFTSGANYEAGVINPFFPDNTVLTVTVDLTTPAAPVFRFYRNGTFYKQRTGSQAAAWFPALSAGYATVAKTAIATLRGTGLQYPVAGFTPWNGA